jgi:iron complex outermembrane receptor protein
LAGPVGTSDRLLQTPLIGLLDSNVNSFAIDAPITKEDSFNKPTWRLSLNYKATPDTLLYASYNRGFRSGGWNTGALASPIEFTFAQPEKNDAYEAGFKSDLFGRSLRINGAAFYYDYSDLQVFTLQPGNPVPFQRLQNADAEIYGAELDVTAQPVDRLELHAAAAYLHTKYTRLNDAIFGDLSGNRLDKSPTWQLSASAAYSAPLNDRLTGRISADVAYQSKMFLSPTNTAPLMRSGYAIANAEVGLTDEQSGLSFTLFVKNLSDKRYLQDAIDVSSFGSFGLFYNEPRTVGATLSFKH